ncbi:MAG: PD-(D/E)XK nuclease domain-containing protein, partial [Prevotellaceae bacterium]|nr:PD-(D/E)XK nuclease domain-containing protein [Prevotellaceae bacterium]
EAVACYVSVESCQQVTEVNEAMLLIHRSICEAAQQLGLDDPTPDTSFPETKFADKLTHLSNIVAPKPLVILFDEVDVLENDPLVRFLRLLRAGFATRGVGIFPTSIALVGMRDLKDYLIKAKDGQAVNPGSPFNIKADSAMLSNFTKDDIIKLFAQRTEEIGQQITQEALDYVCEQSGGQPWIVNSLFMRATLRILDDESTDTVTLEHIRQAREQMIMARETHLDALAYRLDDPRIRNVIESLITGESNPSLANSDAFRLCMDLGLVTIKKNVLQIANPIYKEVIARQMTFSTQLAIPEPSWQWQKSNGELDMDSLLQKFQKFWRQHSEIWEEKSDYTEAFPHLLLMSFLQRVTNGGGDIDREYAAGRGRMDLIVEYAGKCYIIEIKIIYHYNSPAAVKEEGLEQIQRYRDTIDASIPAYLVIFDRRPKAKKMSWNKRISWTVDEASNVTILGC